MAKPIATLSPSHVITDPKLIADYLMAVYVTTDRSQSTLDRGSVKSFSWRCQENGNDINRLASQVAADINSMFSEHFDSSDVECVAADLEDETRSTLVVSGTYTDEGVTYTLADAILRDTGILQNTF